MDRSREDDLTRLKSIFDNHDKPLEIRRNAYKAFQNIRRQIKDKKLVEMRHRLIKAVRANDQEYIQKFEEQMVIYSIKMGYKQ